MIDGSIGEGSPFHATYGYYARGVGEKTAVLPRGRQTRLVPVRNANTRGATGWCREVHDAETPVEGVVAARVRAWIEADLERA